MPDWLVWDSLVELPHSVSPGKPVHNSLMSTFEVVQLFVSEDLHTFKYLFTKERKYLLSLPVVRFVSRLEKSPGNFSGRNLEVGLLRLSAPTTGKC
jgi:hypothetical protein